MNVVCRVIIQVVLIHCGFASFYADAQESEFEGDKQYNWHQWRGPVSTGAAIAGNPPITWSETENVTWKTEIPGLGHSSPIVWNDQVYLTTAIPVGERFEPRPDTAPGAHDNKLVDSEYQFVALAIDRATGKINWQVVLKSAIPHEGAHRSASLASASPVTDGKNVVFSFGTYGLYCLDPQGKIRWTLDLGRMDTKHGHGEGSSPAIFGDTVVVNWDHEKESFIVAVNIETGKELWRKPRQEVTSWSSPIIVTHEGRQQVIVAGTSRVRG